MARQLTGHEDLQFVEHLAIEPPTVQLDAELIDQYEKELEEAIQQQEWTPKREDYEKELEEAIQQQEWTPKR